MPMPLNTWTTGGADAAIDRTVEAIRKGEGTPEFKNARISALALQYDLRESGFAPAAAPAGTAPPSTSPDPTALLVAALEKQFKLDTERREEERLRREDERRRMDRESDADTAHKRAYLTTLEVLYGNTRYPKGDARRGGILHSFDRGEAQQQLLWWAEKGELVVEDVLLFSHLVWGTSTDAYAAIMLRYRDLPSRVRAHNVLVTELMEAEHKDRHPGFKVRNLAKVVGCPFPLLPPVSEAFIRLKQDILDTVPELDPKSVSGGGRRGQGRAAPRRLQAGDVAGLLLPRVLQGTGAGGGPLFLPGGARPERQPRCRHGPGQ